MRIMTLGDSWTCGIESTDPTTKSWPAQLGKKHNVDVVNLARGGSSNKRQMRICYEELARDSNFDYVIIALAQASRTELLDNGKWRQVWPDDGRSKGPRDYLDKIFTELWHPWNEVQETILDCFSFINTVGNFGIPLLVSSLTFRPIWYSNELNWINNYKDDNDFTSLGMPLDELNIGVKDLDRKLKTVRAMHQYNLRLQPEYFTDVKNLTVENPDIIKAHGHLMASHDGHPSDEGYGVLADYYANKIGLTG